ncbi:hypothetical protein ACWT_0073 [Actinoplanes sp. SE50]|uniref:CU044_5270 family protein n=1 Tax=unclassified Actinoplanes TaxID=2626549 RepID=UPI00023ED158|nr:MULTISPECIES: CU044_5270 family protein [unclassified Actinoplanes]AEV81087.1 hypothetical protein ACPL_188 [Actinoplanes sp. SE50/110]ATO79488.1 hypothetical protein ACWT_0073 [Actinoplanes sp. SE50]SLL96888.1 hypothetical protein ACSP50_0077 [Actinoplanes sp. SE50/110]
MDEITLTGELGREVPLPTAADLAPARARLLAELTAAAPPVRNVRKLRLRWAAVATGTVAAAAAAAGIVAIAPGTPSSTSAPPAPAAPVPVAQFLDDAATVAGQGRDVVPRGDQFLYTRVRATDGTWTDYWSSIDGRHLGEERSSSGKKTIIAACVNGKSYDPSDPVDVGCEPTRLYLPDLPTDPERMVAWLKARNPGLDGAPYNANGVAKEIWSLSDSYWLRPAQRAALYRALGRFDGISLVPGAKDGTGQVGTGVSWISPGDTAPRVMWVFDPKRHVLLGYQNASIDAYALVDRIGATH